MNLSDKIKNSKKQTILKVYLKSVKPLVFDGCEAFGDANLTVVVGQAQKILPVLKKNAQSILQKRIEYYGLNSAVPLADYAEFDARIEPFAVVTGCPAVVKRYVDDANNRFDVINSDLRGK